MYAFIVRKWVSITVIWYILVAITSYKKKYKKLENLRKNCYFPINDWWKFDSSITLQKIKFHKIPKL